MALLAAINKRNSAEALDLIAAKADVDVQDKFKNTPLIYACQHNLPEVVNALIVAGADVNIQDNIGYTALAVTCQYNLPHLAVTLIAAKADLNVQINNGNTALMIACDKSFSELALILIAAGADINIRSYYGDTALIYASKFQLAEVILKIANSDSLNYHPLYVQLWYVRKILGLNFSQHRSKFAFRLADTHLLYSGNIKLIKIMMLIRNRANNCLHILPLKVMELLFTNMFS